MKKFYLIILTFLFGMNIVVAEVKTTPRTDSDLGVNKNWNITESNIENIKRTPRVDASEKIYDFASILNETEKENLYSKIDDYISRNHIDLVILTTDLAYSDYKLEEYASDFYDYNDFGIDFEEYSGLILILNLNSYNRYLNIYTFGKAEAYYDYYTCENILDYIYDDIKAANYASGFSKFVERVDYYFDLVPSYNPNNGTNVKYIYHIPWTTAFFVSLVLTTIIMVVLVKKNKMIKKETLANVYLNQNSINYYNVVDKFLHSHTSSYTVNNNSSGSSHSHIGSSGGRHGGGGGRHF